MVLAGEELIEAAGLVFDLLRFTISTECSVKHVVDMYTRRRETGKLSQLRELHIS